MSDERIVGTTGHESQPKWKWDTIVSLTALIVSVVSASYNIYEAQSQNAAKQEQKIVAKENEHRGAFYLGEFYGDLREQLHTVYASNKSAANKYLTDELARHMPLFRAANVTIEPNAYAITDIDSDFPGNNPDRDKLDHIILVALTQITTDLQEQVSFTLGEDVYWLKKAESAPNFAELYATYSKYANVEEYNPALNAAADADPRCAPLPPFVNPQQATNEISVLENCLEGL